MPHYNFKKDLAVAKETEREIAEHFHKIYSAKIIRYENTSDFDVLIELDGQLKKVEIKEDFLCEFTGNVGVEFECRGKASGIQTSKADIYVYKIHHKDGIKVWSMPTEKLKELIRNKEYFRIVSGGDVNSNTKNYLFKYDVFVKNGTMFPIDKTQSV